MPGNVRVGGAWKSVSGVSTKVGGAWKSVSAGFTRVGGVWKQWYSSALAWAGGTLVNSVAHVAAVYAPFSAGKFFGFASGSAISSSTNLYNYSVDGTSWLGGTLPTSALWRAAATNGSRIVIASNTFTTLYSDNGTTWTVSGSMPGSIKIEGLWDGTYFVFSAFSFTGSINWSSDGVTWNTYNGASTSAIGYDGVGTYITIRQDQEDGRINTTDITSAAAWSTITLPTEDVTWSSVNHNGFIWIAAGTGSNLYATSTNGTTWTQRTLPAAMSGSGTGVRPKMAVLDGKFYYVARSGTTALIYSSSDGINWTLEESIANGLEAAQGWAIGPNSLVAVGVAGTNASNLYIRGA